MSLLFGIMITFKISFIIAFSLKQDQPDKKKRKKKGKEKKEKSKKGKKNDKKKKKNKKAEVITPPEKPKHIFEIGKIVGATHIEYELVPKIKYQIDIVCWGPIAKIFTDDGQKILKTVVRNEIAWVPVYMEHYIDHFRLEELKKFCDYIVEFKFFNSVQKLGKMAKSDKPKKFYAYADEATSENLVEVYAEDPNLINKTIEQKRKEALEDMMKDIILRCANEPKNYFVSWLHYPDNYDEFHQFIKKKCDGVEIECKDFAFPCKPWEPFVAKKEGKGKPTTKKGGKAKKEKKNKKGKKEKGKAKKGIVTITVPAEVFFTDPFLAIYKSENNDGVVKHIFLQFSVDRLITRAQKLMLNPLVIRIKKLSNVPVNAIHDLGISSIYVTYNIPYIANCKSIEKPIVKTIRFNEAHIHFNDTTSKMTLIEFIQTRKLFVEIYGKRKPTPSNRPAALFGNEIEDETIAKIIPVNYHEEVYSDNETELLAVCAYDISSLIDNIWDFKEKGQCHEPGLTLFQKSLGYYDVFSYIDVETINEININPEYFKTKGPIPEEMFLKFGTTLQVEVYLLAPQAASLTIDHMPRVFKRLLTIINSAEFAGIILKFIRKHNENIYLEEMKKTVQNIGLSDTVTGFMIDNGNSFLFFIEGLATGAILNIRHAMLTSELELPKILFNSETAYEYRLYSNFLNVGIYSITLRMPLHDILSKQRLYWKGNVPLPCMEALKKLYLLCYSSSYKSIMQYNLLPKPMELVSLNVEWGVPLHLKRMEMAPMVYN